MDDLTVTTESDRMQMDPPGLGEADHLGPDALQAGKIQVSLENHHLPEPKPNQGLVGSAKDWQLSMDLGKQLNLSKNILETRLRPNIVLVSESSKQCPGRRKWRRQERERRRNTQSWWRSAAIGGGELDAYQLKWGEEALQGSHSARPTVSTGARKRRAISAASEPAEMALNGCGSRGISSG